jgi:hypothetical protein
MSYSDEEKQAILQQARETLARTEHVGRVAETSLSAVDKLPPLGEDALTKWRREANEREAELARERDHRDLEAIERRVTNNIMASVQLRIDAAIAGARQDHIESFLPELVSQLRQEIEDDVTIAIEKAYKVATAELRADLNALRETVRKVMGPDVVLDLPPLRSGKPLN